MMRYLPPNGTAGFASFLVRAYKRDSLTASQQHGDAFFHLFLPLRRPAKRRPPSQNTICWLPAAPGVSGRKQKAGTPMRPSPVCRWFCGCFRRFLLRSFALAPPAAVFSALGPSAFAGCRRGARSAGVEQAAWTWAARACEMDCNQSRAWASFCALDRRVVLSRAAEFLRVGVEQLCIRAARGARRSDSPGAAPAQSCTRP